MDNNRKPNLFQSILPILVLVGLLILNVLKVFGDNALGGANQLALLLSTAVAVILAMSIGYKWEFIQQGIIKSIKSALPALIILLLIGALAGTWMLSGVVPAMIYYGLDILNPLFFLPATCIICSIVSIATGSSWTTAATVGIALIGIGGVLGFDKGLVAGAILSGAYFGDKMSPLSDTTNLAPAMAGTDLITHIKYMAYTTIPSIIITLVLFLIIGFTFTSTGSVEEVIALKLAIASKINITPWLFLVPLIVIGLIIRKVAAIPALFLGSILGGIFAVIFQLDLIMSLSEKTNFFYAAYEVVVNAMTTDIAIVTNNNLVNELLSSGGMKGMLNTIWLIICAMIFGGVMEKTGMLEALANQILRLAKSTGTLVTATIFTAIGMNLVAGDQYLAIVIPGRMFKDAFDKRGLAPKNLSRCLEDSGTLTSALIPWNTCGAFMIATLGLAPWTYVPYCILNLVNPLVSIFYGFTGITMEKVEPEVQ